MSRSLRLLALLAIPIVLPHNTLAQPSRAADSAYQAGEYVDHDRHYVRAEEE